LSKPTWPAAKLLGRPFLAWALLFALERTSTPIVDDPTFVGLTGRFRHTAIDVALSPVCVCPGVFCVGFANIGIAAVAAASVVSGLFAATTQRTQTQRDYHYHYRLAPLPFHIPSLA
jgi:hypothetical protein